MLKKVKINNKTIYVKLNDGEFIAWTITDEYLFPIMDCPVFETKKEAVEYRNNSYRKFYKSKREMEKFGLEKVNMYIFAGKLGLEENVPVCSIEDRINEMLGIERRK